MPLRSQPAARGAKLRRKVSNKDPPPPEGNVVDPNREIEPSSAQLLPAIVLSSDLPSDPPSDPPSGGAFVGPKKELYKPKFKAEFDLDRCYAGQLWAWVDEVVQDLAIETTPPQKVIIRDVSACAYKPKTPEKQKLRQSLERGEGAGFMQVIEYAQHLKESSIDATYVDFEATLGTESVEVISPIGQQRSRGSSSSKGQVRLTATQRQLQELPEILAGHAVADGPSIAIRDKWRCQDTHCGNYPYVCWIQRTAGQPDRFENHYPISSNVVAMWARNVTLGKCSVNEPDDIIRVALRTSRELAAKEKAKEKAQQSSTPAFTADSFMSAIAASALSVSQLAHSQLLARQAPVPAAPAASSASTPSVPVSGWRDLTYENNIELSYHTRYFFDWWMDQAMAVQVPDIKRVLTEVVKGGQIDLNMLMDGSNAGMPYNVWREDFELPVPLLLRLRRMAIQWRFWYTGLFESDQEDCRKMQRRDNKWKRRLRTARVEDRDSERQSSER
ncbi:hypothetical protein PMIN01_13527 [Paraphaeosphaeria minitans]|uniref:Uncharacterized protein n=1 Tax=Paraphaeosphaeria minitans TaxID=565426 RepID=A0A9P6KJH0_9PLEO|nr:hypothetical protein PMIN01_13527 [Paraphaeosphaeria minitans]